ncbi:MAG TPA: cupin domain-containing protein [Actinomycetota bacterium]|nr:cupin domain-containing protein [Actinomycetota bacterium]
MSGIDQGRAGKDPPLLRPGEGVVLTARGSVMAFKAVAEQTDGDFSLMERTLPPGGRRPPAHRHTNCSEAFFILEGTVTVELEGATVAAGRGDFVRASRGQAHTLGNAGDTPARLLVLHAPAMDAYFRKLHELWSADEPPSPERERDLMRRYGMDLRD